MISSGLLTANVALAVEVCINVSCFVESFITVLALVPVILFISGPLGLRSVAVSFTLGSGAVLTGLRIGTGCICIIVSKLSYNAVSSDVSYLSSSISILISLAAGAEIISLFTFSGTGSLYLVNDNGSAYVLGRKCLEGNLDGNVSGNVLYGISSNCAYAYAINLNVSNLVACVSGDSEGLACALFKGNGSCGRNGSVLANGNGNSVSNGFNGIVGLNGIIGLIGFNGFVRLFAGLFAGLFTRLFTGLFARLFAGKYFIKQVAENGNLVANSLELIGNNVTRREHYRCAKNHYNAKGKRYKFSHWKILL